MALISKPNTFTAGTVIVASEHNDNFDTIYNDYNGNITNANLAAGASIADTKLAQITTANKVHGTSITGLASVPAGAGALPEANLPTSISTQTTFTDLIATTLQTTNFQIGSGVIATDILDEDDMASDSAVKLATQQSIKAYADSVAHKYAAGATEYLFLEDSNAASTASASYVKAKEYVLARDGEIRVDMTFAISGGASAEARVYKNGVAEGTEQSNTTSATKTEDISGWSAGDLLQIYIKATGGGTCQFTKAELYATVPTAEVILQVDTGGPLADPATMVTMQ